MMETPSLWNSRRDSAKLCPSALSAKTIARSNQRACSSWFSETRETTEVRGILKPVMSLRRNAMLRVLTMPITDSTARARMRGMTRSMVFVPKFLAHLLSVLLAAQEPCQVEYTVFCLWYRHLRAVPLGGCRGG